MNRSSLFTFEESPVWDPKIIRKLVVVPQDELIKLNSIPGWTKVQDEHNNTLRLDKDFPIENSQSICSVTVTQSNKIIENNIQLFSEQIKKRKDILKAYKVYEKKLNKSLSLLDLNKSCGTLLGNNILKRALSLQDLYHSSNTSSINSNFEKFISKNSSEKNPSNCSSEDNILYKPLKNITLSNQCEISVLEPKEKEILLINEIDSSRMETALQPPVNVPAVAENVNAHFQTEAEIDNILPTENGTAVSNNKPDPVTQSLIANKADLSFETPKESDGMVLAENDIVVPSKISESVNVVSFEKLSEIVKERYEMLSAKNITAMPGKSDQFIKYLLESVNADKNNLELLSKYAKVLDDSSKSMIVYDSDKLSLNKVTESDDSVVMIENDKLDKSIEKESPDHVIPVSNNENITLSSTTEEQILLSNSGNKNETDSVIVKDRVFSDPSANAKIIHDKSSNLLENNRPFVPSLDKHVTLDSNCSEEVVPPVVTSVEKSIDLESHKELRPSKSARLDIPAEQLPISRVEIASETKNLVKNSGSGDMKTKDEIDASKCNATLFPPNNEASFPKKRKLETRNKKSKRVKSEEKQSNIKIRSIKKVGEVCYSGEEVKTMLDIMKQFL